MRTDRWARWRDLATRVRAEVRDDRLTLLAAGVAFFAVVALVPALVAVVSVYGLVADPADVERQVEDVLASAPDEVRDLARRQLEDVTSSSGAGLGLGVGLGVAVALWSASVGMKGLVEAVNAVYDGTTRRTLLDLRVRALLLTLGAVLFVVAAVFVLAVAPGLLGDGATWAVSILRWPALAAGWMVGLAVLYRVAPDRDDLRWRWVTPGTAAATVVWLAGSVAFSLYTTHVADYGQTHGSLGAVVATMLWLWLTAVAVLLGAEVDAQVRAQSG